MDDFPQAYPPRHPGIKVSKVAPSEVTLKTGGMGMWVDREWENTWGGLENMAMSEESKPVNPATDGETPAPRSEVPAQGNAADLDPDIAGDLDPDVAGAAIDSTAAAAMGEAVVKTEPPIGGPPPAPSTGGTQTPGDRKGYEDDIWSDDDDIEVNLTVDTARVIPPTLGAGDAADWDLEDVNWTAPPPAPLVTEPALGLEFITQIKQLLGQGQRLWRRLLAGVRSRLPVTAQWPDALLGGVLIGSLLLLLILANGLQGPSPAAASGGDAPALETDFHLEDGPDPALSAPTTVDPAVIGEVQTQLTTAAALYGDGLVQSVQVNLNRSRLTVNLSPGWYRLTATAQTDLVADLQQRSQTLAFKTLDVRSPDDDLLARSPVVGEEMVILQRQLPPQVPQPDRPRYRLLID